MRKREAERLGDILPEVIGSAFGKDCQLHILESRVIESWSEVIGVASAAYTGDLKMVDGTLTVKVSSPFLRHELFMQRSNIVAKLNEKVGAQVVLKIMLL